MARVTIDVEITGTTPFLMHRFGEAAQVDGEHGKGTRKIHVGDRDPRTEAEASAYRDADGRLYFPGAAIMRLLREAGGSHKQRGSRKAIKYVVPAAVRCSLDAVPFYDPKSGKRLDTFEVDSRPVTIPATKGRIMRHRPRLDAWRAVFPLVVRDDLLAVETVQMLLTEGGDMIGIGDFRPEKGGPFGVFAVTKWTVEGEKQPRAARDGMAVRA